MAKRSTDTTRPSRTQMARPAITLERAAAACPDAQIAANIARHFALDPVDYDAVREAHEEAVGNMSKAFDTTLNDKAMAMHFQRVVGALVGSAFGAGGFYGQKVSEARDLTAKSANEDRDEDRDGVYGFESKAQRARKFAAEMGLQAFAQLAAAEGAVHAYAAITGEEWKPYVAPTDNTQSVNRQSAAAELDAFGE